MVVKNILNELGITPQSVSLGEIELKENDLPHAVLLRLDARLKEVGFERIDDKRSRLIQKIKALIIEKIHHSDRTDLKFNWSTVLSEALHYDYNYLSGLFSSVEGITLEQYIIRQKIEKVKELLFYDELNLNEIADKLGYSSVQHLSAQFRRVTGSTPSAFKRFRKAESRNGLDAL